MIEKLVISGVCWRWCVIFKLKVREILKFWVFLTLQINLNFKTVFSRLNSIVKVLFTFGSSAQVTLIYLLRKVVCLFCLFIMLRFSKPQHLLLCTWYPWKAFNECSCTKVIL
jgi:hypothetical protein